MREYLKLLDSKKIVKQVYIFAIICVRIDIWQKKKRWRKDNVYSYKSRRKILLERCKSTCQKCNYNKDGKMLDVHHYDHNHKNNRYSNLRILCVWCHAKHHRLKKDYILPQIISDKEMDLEVKKC